MDAATTDINQASRSQSPDSRPPIPTTPGPRATALQKLYGEAIAHVLKTCNYNNFSACFPTPAKHVPGSLKGLHDDFTVKLGDSMRLEFESLLEERHVVSSLNELDVLIEDARKRRGKAREGDSEPIPPHTLPAQQLYLSHLAPTLDQHSKEMRERQDTVQAENVDLLERVMQQRRDIRDLFKGMEDAISDLDASVEHLASEETGVNELRNATRAADEEMRSG